MTTLEQCTHDVLLKEFHDPAPAAGTPQSKEELAQTRDELLNAVKTLIPDLYSLAVNNPENRMGRAGLQEIWKVVDMWRKRYDQAEYADAAEANPSVRHEPTWATDDPNT
jgi:hypothetical protein